MFRAHPTSFLVRAFDANDVLIPKVTRHIANSQPVSLESFKTVTTFRPMLEADFFVDSKINIFDCRILYQFRFYKGAELIKTVRLVKMFGYQVEAVPSEKFEIQPLLRRGAGLVGRWHVDAGVKLLTPQARALIKPGKFEEALNAFVYNQVGVVEFDVSNLGIKILPSGEVEGGRPLTQLRNISVELNDI